ncbi:MAG: GNAT family N-acetyltransferase [Muribaculaceae bacterium]|nr:GNAT family N-acetyltransferase [Muribaculaceae bacterium]
MDVISFHNSARQELWLEEIKRSDWGAGAFLHELLSSDTFFDAVGEGSKVLLLTDGDELISYCTYARWDDIQPTELSPWMGFIYTFPEHRGHRYAGRLFEEVERLAQKEDVPAVYISTNHVGLYEKYGCEFLTMMDDMDGNPSRVYVKKILMQNEGIILRHWHESDAKVLFKYASDPDVGPRAGWPPHKSVDESLEIIRTVFNNHTTWAIVLKETGEPIGAIGYGPSCDCNLPCREDEPIAGYWIAKPYWNQGICTEALTMMIEHIRETTDIPSLISGHFIDNPASGRVMEKCGFVATGETCIDENQYQGKDRPIRVLRLSLK